MARPRRAFRDMMGWRPYGEPASPLHELLAGEVFRLWEKTRRANNPSAAEIHDDEPVRISPAPHKFGDTLPEHVEVTIKAGLLRQACKEKRKRATAIYDSLCSDPSVLAGSLEEAPPDAFTSSKPANRTVEYGMGMDASATGRACLPGNVGDSGGGPSTPQPPRLRMENGVPPQTRDPADVMGRRALSSLLSTLASRCSRENGPEVAPASSSASEYRSCAEDFRGARGVTSCELGDTGDPPSGEEPAPKRSRLDAPPVRESNGSRPSGSGGAAASGGDLNVGVPGRRAETDDGAGARQINSDDAASAARRQLWYREVQANDARLKAIKEEAEREHAVRMRQLMCWIVDEEGGKHSGLGANAGPGPANWER